MQAGDNYRFTAVGNNTEYIIAFTTNTGATFTQNGLSITNPSTTSNGVVCGNG